MQKIPSSTWLPSLQHVVEQRSQTNLSNAVISIFSELFWTLKSVVTLFSPVIFLSSVLWSSLPLFVCGAACSVCLAMLCHHFFSAGVKASCTSFLSCSTLVLDQHSSTHNSLQAFTDVPSSQCNSLALTIKYYYRNHNFRPYLWASWRRVNSE